MLSRIQTVTRPLHRACDRGYTTNLDFIELLLENGANPNAQDARGLTPLMRTAMHAPGAAKFLLERASADVNTDVNITTQDGESFLALVRLTIVALPDNPDRAKDQFVLQQWREIEKMLVERGAIDTRITDLE
jgi:ankyrin repeat protein